MKPAFRRQAAKDTAQAVLWFVFAIVVLAFTPDPGRAENTNEDLRREWLSIQVDGDRRAQARWWRELDYERMRQLVGARVLLDVEDRRGWTPLHSAARFNPDSRILVALLDGGADVNARDKAGDTPLHWAAAENNNVQVVRELISAGADVNASDRYGWLPLHTAVERNGNPDIVRELLDSGADTSKRAYFILFGPKFLLRHNPNMSDDDKRRTRALLDADNAAEESLAQRDRVLRR